MCKPENFSFSKISLSPAISLDELFDAINVKRITWNITNPEINDPILT